jgi:hypothetical protein
MKRRAFAVIFMAFIMVGLPAIAGATNLIQNPSFSTGDFTDWTVLYAPTGGSSSNIFVAGSPYPVYPGDTYAAQFMLPVPPGSLSNLDQLSQTVTVTAGKTYTVGFYVYNQTPAGTVNPLNFFGAYFNSSPLTYVYNADGNGGWTDYTFLYTPTVSGTATINFQGYGGFSLDNISVGAVPEPSTLLLLGCGLVGLAAFRKRLFKKV